MTMICYIPHSLRLANLNRPGLIVFTRGITRPDGAGPRLAHATGSPAAQSKRILLKVVKAGLHWEVGSGERDQNLHLQAHPCARKYKKSEFTARTLHEYKGVIFI